MREIFLRAAAVRGFWGHFLPLDLRVKHKAPRGEDALARMTRKR